MVDCDDKLWWREGIAEETSDGVDYIGTGWTLIDENV